MHLSILFQWFRQTYCRYDDDLLDNLEHSQTISNCQKACQVNPLCNFFTFMKSEEVCVLHQVDLSRRACDLIHGPPSPGIQACLDEDKIPWARSSKGKPFENSKYLYFSIYRDFHILYILHILLSLFYSKQQ